MEALALAIEPVTVKTTVVRVAGELDRASVDQLYTCVRAVEPGSTAVILDLRDLTFMDSMGVGAFVTLHRELDTEARMLQIRNLCGQPQRAIEMTSVDQLLYLI